MNNTRDPMLPIGTDKCQCAACGEYFNSTFAFDKHRIGRPGVDRRCRSGDELLADGWGRNATGHWITAVRGAETMPGHTQGG